MRIQILRRSSGLSAFTGELLTTWGLNFFDFVDADTPKHPSAPILIALSQTIEDRHADVVMRFVRDGGTLVTFLPPPALQTAAGIELREAKSLPLRLRVTRINVQGLAGELLPIVGDARQMTMSANASYTALGFLCHSDRYADETPGIVESRIGTGRVISFAFDLPLAVLLLRQGDPSRAGMIPPTDMLPRPSHLAWDIGPRDCGFAPYADLLGRVLVDLIRERLAGPAPMLSHLPGAAPAVVLFSGDEDWAPVDATLDEIHDVADTARGRMNLYIIPERTESTAADVARFREKIDVGPHPNLEDVADQPIPKRTAEFERQVRLFNQQNDMRARTVRNHRWIWAGYLEMAEAQERVGLKMDANYGTAVIHRWRDHSPYGGFGSSLPMRFCQLDGRLIDVFQQHYHCDDNVLLGEQDYAYRFSDDQYEAIFTRVLTDSATRFHNPVGFNYHPGNWVKYSAPAGRKTLEIARRLGIPIWSYDQWLNFWEARDSWRFTSVEWDGSVLRVNAEGSLAANQMCLSIPDRFGTSEFEKASVEIKRVTRAGVATILLSIPDGAHAARFEIRYRSVRNADIGNPVAP